jgi:chromosome segregation ATPase
MSLTKDDLKNIEGLLKGKFDKIDERFEEIEKRLETHELIFTEIFKRFDKVDKKFDEIEKRLMSHELTFLKMFKRFDTLERNLTKYHIRENNNRDRLDKGEIDIDDLRMSIFDYNYGDIKTKIKP